MSAVEYEYDHLVTVSQSLLKYWNVLGLLFGTVQFFSLYLFPSYITVLNNTNL